MGKTWKLKCLFHCCSVPWKGLLISLVKCQNFCFNRCVFPVIDAFICIFTPKMSACYCTFYHVHCQMACGLGSLLFVCLLQTVIAEILPRIASHDHTSDYQNCCAVIQYCCNKCVNSKIIKYN